MPWGQAPAGPPAGRRFVVRPATPARAGYTSPAMAASGRWPHQQLRPRRHGRDMDQPVANVPGATTESRAARRRSQYWAIGKRAVREASETQARAAARSPTSIRLGVFGAINAQTGKVAWADDMPQLAKSGLVVAGNLVFSGHSNGQFDVAGAATGKLLWTFNGTSLRRGAAERTPPQRLRNRRHRTDRQSLGAAKTTAASKAPRPVTPSSRSPCPQRRRPDDRPAWRQARARGGAVNSAPHGPVPLARRATPSGLPGGVRDTPPRVAGSGRFPAKGRLWALPGGGQALGASRRRVSGRTPKGGPSSARS
jgi:hypothetical protein